MSSGQGEKWYFKNLKNFHVAVPCLDESWGDKAGGFVRASAVEGFGLNPHNNKKALQVFVRGVT